MSLEGGETDSGVVVETISEYSSQTHLLTKNSVFGVRVRLDSSKGSKGARDKDVRESQNMGTSTEEMKGGDEISSLSTSSFTASSSSSLMLNPKGSGENKDDKSNEGSVVVKFAVSELFVKKGCTSPSPAAVSCKNCGKKLGPYINFGALVGHAKYCSRDDLHTCEICNKRFNRFSLYQKHIYREHGIGFSDKDFSCASCGKGFQSESLLFKHLKRTKCGLSDGVKRKANASASSCVSSSGSSSSSGGGGKSTKMRKKVAQKEPETNTPLLGKKCKTVALVNHSGHMDWLLSCNTLLCSESEKGVAHESWHHGDEHQHEHQLLDPKKGDQHHNHDMKSSSLNHPNIRPEVNSANHGNEVVQEGKREADEADIQCFMGCEQHVYKDGGKQCERLLNATRVRHNDHWDYVVNDRLLHVYQDPTLGQIQEDHGSFKFLSEDLEFDW